MGSAWAPIGLRAAQSPTRRHRMPSSRPHHDREAPASRSATVPPTVSASAPPQSSPEPRHRCRWLCPLTHGDRESGGNRCRPARARPSEPSRRLLNMNTGVVAAHLLGGHEYAASIEIACRVLEQQLRVLALLRSRNGQRSGPPGGRDGPSSREPFARRSARSSSITITSTGQPILPTASRRRTASATRFSTSRSMTRKSRSLSRVSSPRAANPNRITRAGEPAASARRRPASSISSCVVTARTAYRQTRQAPTRASEVQDSEIE
jgi:hypothetical protein